MPIRKNVRIPAERAGAEYPDQLPMIGTPYGRGRRTPSLTSSMASSRKNRLHRNTSRCCQRRNAIVNTTADSPATVAPQPEPAATTPLATPVSHGARARAKTRSTAALA